MKVQTHIPLQAKALEKRASKNEEVTDRHLASLTKASKISIVILKNTNTHIIVQDTPGKWHTMYKVKRFERPTTLRLIQTNSNDHVAEEAVFTIQGVLSAKNLPPVMENTR